MEEDSLPPGVPRDLREAQHASEWVLKSNGSCRERPEHHLVEVTREDEAFVRWMEAHERDSIPWMRSVLEALTAAHADKLREEWLRKMRREALRGKEALRPWLAHAPLSRPLQPVLLH